MKEIKLYKSPWSAIKLILLCSIFIACGIFMLRSSDSPGWVWFYICFFGLGIPVGTYQLLDRRPQIIINEIGILDCTVHQDVINWKVIHDASLTSAYGQKYIYLVLDKDYETGNFPKELAKKLGAQELHVRLGQLKIDEKRLAEFIRMMMMGAKHARKEEDKSDQQSLT